MLAGLVLLFNANSCRTRGVMLSADVFFGKLVDTILGYIEHVDDLDFFQSFWTC